MTTTTSSDGALVGRLEQLTDRLIWAARVALDAGEIAQARATAEDVRTLDPGNAEARDILRRVDEMQRHPAGERTLMTLLFSDVVASTELAEELEPEALRDIFGMYRTFAEETTEYYGGRVVKYLGDGVLATFGYPRAHEDDARRGVLAAVDLVARVADAQQDIAEQFGVEFAIRVGIHTGRVVVADLGSGTAREHSTILGVAPNLAARIQSEASSMQVVVSDVTAQLIESDFDLTSIGIRDLKGISRGVEAFVVDGVRPMTARLDAERYRQGVTVGRGDVTSTLSTAWDEVRTDNGGHHPGRCFLLAGEAGIGKSRIVVDLRGRVLSTGGDTLATGCSPYHGDIALWPISQMLLRFAGLDELPPPDRGEALEAHLSGLGLDVDASMPFLAHVLGIDAAGHPVPELDPLALREASISALLGWLAALGNEVPRLLVVEDLEWADPSTLEILGREAPEPPHHMLFVMTTRDDRFISWRDRTVEIALAPLDEESARALIDRIDTDGAIDEPRRAAIVAKAEGIPLYVEELTRSALTAEADDEMPLRLEEILVGRLRGQQVDLLLAQMAATIGTRFDEATLGLVADRPVHDALAGLERAEIIERITGASGEFRFRHGMLRDAAYETMVAEAKVETHRRIAEVLADAGGAASLIARHHDAAGDAVAALQHYIAAAQEAQAQGSHAEAGQLLQRAFEIVTGFPEGQERDLGELTVRMLRTLSISSVQGYAAPGVRDDFTAAGELVERLGDRPESMPSVIAIWAYWLVASDLAAARKMIGQLVAMVEQPAFSWFRPEVNACAGFQCLFEGRVREARVYLERAIEEFDSRPPEAAVSEFWPLPHDPCAVSAIAMANVATLQGDGAEAAAWEARAVEYSASLPFPRGPFSSAFVKTYAAWLRLCGNDWTESRRLAAEIIAIGEKHGFGYWMALGAVYAAETSSQLTEALTTLRAIGHEAFRASYERQLARLLADEGNLIEALAMIDEAMATVGRSGERLHIPDLLVTRARLQLDSGADALVAKRDLEEAAHIAEEQGSHLYALLARVDLAKLPDEARPSHWRESLVAALEHVPEDSPFDLVQTARRTVAS